MLFPDLHAGLYSILCYNECGHSLHTGLGEKDLPSFSKRGEQLQV